MIIDSIDDMIGDVGPIVLGLPTSPIELDDPEVESIRCGDRSMTLDAWRVSRLQPVHADGTIDRVSYEYKVAVRPGSALWVREPFRIDVKWDGSRVSAWPGGAYWYGSAAPTAAGESVPGVVRSAGLMLRSMSRITLIVRNVELSGDQATLAFDAIETGIDEIIARNTMKKTYRIDVEHVCGHIHNHTICGPGVDCIKKHTWLTRHVCPLCFYGADRPCSAFTVIDKADAIASDHGVELPSLSGTHKQVLWAKTLRAERLVRVDNMANDPSLKRFFVAMMAHSGGYVGQHNMAAASFWINNRSTPDETFIKWVVAERAWKESLAAGNVNVGALRHESKP